MSRRIVNIIKAILPLLFLYAAYWFIGFIPVTGIYYPQNLAVYSEPITIFVIIAFILTFLVIAVGVFNIRSVKRLGLIFLIYQPIKLIVDLTGTAYESRQLYVFTFYSVNFLTIFLCIGTAVVILKNKEDARAWHTGLAKFLLRCIPVTLISILIPILENIIVLRVLDQTLPYGAEEIFNTIIIVMSVTSAALTIMLGIFMRLAGAAFDCDQKLISAEALKPLIFSILFSIAIPIVRQLILRISQWMSAIPGIV